MGVSSAMGQRCSKAVVNYLLEVHRRMLTVPTESWSQVRWQDFAYLAQWALDQDAQGQPQGLWDASELSQQQGWPWDDYYHQTGTGHSGAFVNKSMPKFPEANVGACESRIKSRRCAWVSHLNCAFLLCLLKNRDHVRPWCEQWHGHQELRRMVSAVEQ